jgi:hypothetical protein
MRYLCSSTPFDTLSVLVSTSQVFLASGDQLQVLVASGAWQHMNPPGFKRVHRSLLYRQRPDGTADVHRVLANSEDVVKTRMIKPLEKVSATLA